MPGGWSLVPEGRYIPRPMPQSKPNLAAWSLLTPMLLWLLIFVIAPTAILFVYSFGQTDDVGQVIRPDNVNQSFDNYRRIVAREPQDEAPWPHFLSERRYVWILLRSIWYAGLATLACVVIGYPIAFVIGRIDDPWRNRLLVAVMVPFWTSFLIRTYAWVTILSGDGLLSSLLKHLHLINGSLDILYTPTAVMIGLVYTYLPFMILPIYGSVQKLDVTLLEAAGDLGAGPWRTFTRVIWPLTLPGVGAGVVLTFVPAIAMFAVNDLLGGGRVEMIGNTIETQFNTSRDWPFGSALGIVVTALFAIAFALGGRRTDDITS